MKRYKRLAGRIKRGYLYSEQGSIVLEAAIVVPIIMLTLLAFIIFISLYTVQMALHATASQAVRQVAAHVYPIELALRQDTPHAGEPNESVSEPSKWREIAAEAAEWMPDPSGALMSSALRGDWRPTQNMAATLIGRSIIEPLLRNYASSSVLNTERIRLEYVTLPDLQNKKDTRIGIAIQYEFPLKLPLVNKPLFLKAEAFERVWISDALPATYGAEGGEYDGMLLQIVSIEPAPLRPGRKATVVVKTVPNAAITLDVVYKSGSSKAKHLGQAVADENGFVQWTWHVSGNTTPGIWQLTAASVKIYE